MIDLLLIHGWGLSHNMWDTFTKYLLQDNSIKKSPMKIHYASPYDNAVDSILVFMEAYHKNNDNDNLIVMGHSLGGLKILESPLMAMADGIILVNSFTKFTKSSDFKHGINGKVLSRMISKFANDPMNVLTDFLDQNDILKHIQSMDYMKDLNTSDLLQGLEDLQHIDCRKLANHNNIYSIQGDSDPLISTYMYDHMHSASPNIHAITYQNAGHFIPHTHSKDLINHMKQIINSVSNKVVSNFNSKALSYNSNAQIQEVISNKLIHYLNSSDHTDTQKILELGCGTGLFTKHLVENFPNARLMTTDLSFNMLKQNNLHLLETDHNLENIKFKQVNALTEMDNFPDNSFDLICSSMLFQWFEDPIEILKLWQPKLKPNGIFAVSLLGDKSFDTINDYINKHDFISIFNAYPSINYFQNNGILVYEDDCYFEYTNLKALLKTMINTGANHNKQDTKSNNQLKTLLKHFNNNTTIRWNSIFLIGRII